MLAAVGPLLRPGPAGYFLYPDGMLAPLICESGGAGLDAGAIAATADPWISQGRPVVALLTDARRGRTQCVRPRLRRGARALGCYSSSETVTFTITTGSLG